MVVKHCSKLIEVEDMANTENTEVENEEIIAKDSEAKDVIEEEIANHQIPKQEDDYKAKYYYLAAEVENMRRRFQKEKEDTIKYGSTKILESLISVLDNFDLTVNAIKADQDEKMKNIAIGIDMVRNQFLDVLKQNGLTPIEALGKQFDPNFHEAMSQKAEPEKKDEEIIAEFQKGYILNGRVLRASKVVIAKN